MVRNCFLLIAVFQAFVSAEEHWGYANMEGELDPNHWYVKYKDCIGNRQSPIDIEKSDVQYDPTLKPLQFEGYDLPIHDAHIINDGHTVRVDMPDDSQAFVISSSFNTTYKLKQFHFHWGHHDNTGSEHVVFRKRFPLEMHLVHADETVSYDQALTEPFGLVVVSVLFKFGKTTDGMLKFTKKFSEIKDPVIKNSTTIRDLNLLDFLPANIENYLQYAGSLTTPPCNEAVKWIILTHTGYVTHSQMADFRTLKHIVNENGKSEEQQLENNDRTLQGIKGRKVSLYYDFDNLIH